VQTSYTYEPFGAATSSGATNTNTYQFTGRENDGATGLYFYRARYYSPTFGRFISEDPIEFSSGSVNLYAYVDNSPFEFSDPLGLEQQGCGGYVKFTIGVWIFAASVYRDACGWHFGGSVQASLLPASASLTFTTAPISCSSFNADAFIGTGGEVGVGESQMDTNLYGEIGVGTPNASVGVSGVLNCPNG
jgi:RHS repeat-associated protein